MPAIEARALSKRFLLRHNRAASLKVLFLGLVHAQQREVVEQFWALKELSVSIARGEAVGIVGRNGSGKSTFLKLVAGIHRPTTGQLLVERGARIGTMIELGVGFHPDLNGTENVFLNAAIHGLSRREIEAIYPAIVEYSGLGHFMDVALKNYSSGMHMRLGFAIAANLDPDVLLLDEIFAVGDEDFQKQCMKTMERFASEGRTLLFVSHAAASVRALCRRVCLLDHGRLLFDGEVDAGLSEYQRLMAAASPPTASSPAASSPAASSPAASSPAASSPAAVPTIGEPEAPAGDSPRDGSREWALELLKREGLQPHHRVLEVTCGAASQNDSLSRFVGADRYQHWEITVPNAAPPRPFDYAIASPLLSQVSLNVAARCLTMALRVMRPDGRIYATWLDNPDPAAVPDVPPFGYPFEMLAGIGGALGAHVSRVSDSRHPGGEMVLVLVRP